MHVCIWFIYDLFALGWVYVNSVDLMLFRYVMSLFRCMLTLCLQFVVLLPGVLGVAVVCLFWFVWGCMLGALGVSVACGYVVC